MNELLKELRRSKGLTGDQMAEIIGLTKASYSKKETGSIKFSLREAKVIADYFGMQIEGIFFANNVSKMETDIFRKEVS